jgi:pyruvate kinase
MYHVQDIADIFVRLGRCIFFHCNRGFWEYPVEAAMVLSRISKAAEAHLKEFSRPDDPVKALYGATEASIGRAACSIAEEPDSTAIVAATSSGSTARLVARFRPLCIVLAFTPDPLIERQLTISRGIVPVFVSSFKTLMKSLTWLSYGSRKIIWPGKVTG